jgi:hypothetical protein
VPFFLPIFPQNWGQEWCLLSLAAIVIFENGVLQAFRGRFDRRKGESYNVITAYKLQIPEL